MLRPLTGFNEKPVQVSRREVSRNHLENLNVTESPESFRTSPDYNELSCDKLSTTLVCHELSWSTWNRGTQTHLKDGGIVLMILSKNLSTVFLVLGNCSSLLTES